MPINQTLLAELKHESVNSRKIIERIPTDKLLWSPHEKSMTIGRLATHIAQLPIWFERIIKATEFDFASSQFKSQTLDTTSLILETFDKFSSDAIQVLESADDDNLNAVWTSRRGDRVLFQLPRKVVIRNFALNHVYHHRGQLSVYLRLLDIPVPGMYGPSADEK